MIPDSNFISSMTGISLVLMSCSLWVLDNFQGRGWSRKSNHDWQFGIFSPFPPHPYFTPLLQEEESIWLLRGIMLIPHEANMESQSQKFKSFHWVDVGTHWEGSTQCLPGKLCVQATWSCSVYLHPSPHLLEHTGSMRPWVLSPILVVGTLICNQVICKRRSGLATHQEWLVSQSGRSLWDWQLLGYGR